MIADKKSYCAFCHAQLHLEINDKVGRHEECPLCKRSLRCCKMCSFYDRHAYNECKEPNAERIIEKERANFCSYFTLSCSTNNNSSSQSDLLAAANALFKF